MLSQFNRPLPQSALILIFSNFLVLISAVYFNFNIFHILLIYIIETFFMTSFFLMKVLFVSKKGSSTWLLINDAIGTLLFCFFYFFAILFLFFLNGSLFWKILFEKELTFYSFLLSIVVLFFSHLFSFIVNLKKDFNNQRMITRVAVIHISIIFGGIISIFIGNLLQGILILFIILKTIIDLYYHLKFYKLNTND